MKQAVLTLLSYVLPVNIHQFDEEEQGAGGTAPGTADQGTAGDGDQHKEPDDQTPDLNAQFEEMIKGDYKDAFASRTQKIIDERFKTHKTLETEHNKLKTDHDDLSVRYNKAEEALKRKYGTETVEEAIVKMEAESMEAEAYEEGVDVSVIETRRENAQLKKDLAESNTRLQQQNDSYAQQLAFQKQLESWKTQETEVKKVYPEFNLTAASENDKFARLLAANVDVQTAYEVSFKEQIREEAMKRAQNNDRAKENAAEKNKKQDYVIEKSAKDLTKEERLEAIKRMRKGEKVSFDV